MKGLAIVLLLLAVSAASCLQVSLGAVYQVGDSNSWTILGNVNYTKWAESKLTKHFQVGDTVQFAYNADYHNVLQVTEEDHKSCNASKPISSFSSGYDSLIIGTPGHHFFICGIKGHCQKGQKVDIYVVAPPLSAAADLKGSLAHHVAPAPAPSSVYLVAPAPAPSSAHSLNVKHGFVVAVFIIFMSNMFLSK